MIDKNDPRLTAFVLGELDNAEMQMIEHAISESEELRLEVDQIRMMCSRLSHELAIDSSGENQSSEHELQLSAEQRNAIENAISKNDQAVVSKESRVTSLKSKNTRDDKGKLGQRTWLVAACIFLIGGISTVFVINEQTGYLQHKSSRVATNDIDENLSENVQLNSLKNELEIMDSVKAESNSIEKSRANPENRITNQADPNDVNKFGLELSDLVVDQTQEVQESGIQIEPGELENVAGGKVDNFFSGNPLLSLAEDNIRTKDNGGGGRSSGEASAGVGGEFERKNPRPRQSFSELGQPGHTADSRDGKSGQKSDSELVNLDENLVRQKYTKLRLAREIPEVLIEQLESISNETDGENGKRRQTTVGDLKKLINQTELEHVEVLQRLGNGHPTIQRLERQITFYKSLLEKEDEPPKSWKRVKATPNTSRLMVGDKDELAMTGMQVDVQVDGFRARVVIDYFFYNDRDRQLEGSFKMRLPNEASPYFFAFGESRFDYSPQNLDTTLKQNFVRPNREQFVSLTPDNIRRGRKDTWDKVKEARMVPRQKAAFAYQQTTKRRIDPALVEWAGAGVFNAKVFPLTPHKLHRIVVGYDVDLSEVDDRWIYDLELPENTGNCQVDFRVTTTDVVTSRPKIEIDHFENSANFHLNNPTEKSYRISIQADRDVVLLTGSAQENQPQYFATKVKLPFESDSKSAASHGVFLVDTSLSNDPQKFNLWLKMLKTILDSNRDSMKRFSVVFFNVESYWWKNEYLDNNSKNVTELMNYCESLSLEGATDLYTGIRMVTKTAWIGDAKSARPDLFLLSDGAATWGETNLQLIGNLLESDAIGSLYAYQGGMSGTSIRTLQFLANKTGGALFSVANENEVVAAATAHRKKPWRIVSIEAVGTSDVMTAGRIQWLYPGQQMTIVGRFEGNEIANIDESEFADLFISVEQNGVEKAFRVKLGETVNSQLAFRIFGQVAVGQLENLGSSVGEFATAYARNFRVTGQSCSLLMLESQADYERFNIKPEEDEFVVASRACSRIVNEKLEKDSVALSDPKEMLKTWLKSLETAPQINFKIPTALKMVIDDVDVPEIYGRLGCQIRTKSQASAEYARILASQNLDYDQIVAEAKRRAREFGSDDAIKSISNLLEKNPGEMQLTRDIAFMAMEFGKPEQAYPLLKRVAMSRPYDGIVYSALAHCLVEMGQVDLAMVFYEVAVGGTFQKSDFRFISATEYCALLSQVSAGRHPSKLKAFARSRLATLIKQTKFKESDVVVTMMWNTDRSDIDLHVIDPNSEECFYKHNRTKMGGKLTSDITDGFGPEMFWLPNAQKGNYQVAVNYYGSDNLRTGMRSKVYVTVYRNFGRENQTIDRKTVSLGKSQEKRTVLQFRIK